MNTQTLVASIIPMILAITVHEAAHAFAAFRFGDSTAKRQGRMTLSPFSHIDPVGTILIPAITLFTGGFFFGWAKPVPVNPSSLRNPKSDMFWVAAAGPASNLIMAIIWGWLAFQSTSSTAMLFLHTMALSGVMINLSLMALNLLPIPPLDGSKLVDRFLPYDLSRKWTSLDQYGLWIVLGLSFTGILSFLMSPLVSIGLNLVKALTPL